MGAWAVGGCPGMCMGESQKSNIYHHILLINYLEILRGLNDKITPADALEGMIVFFLLIL